MPRGAETCMEGSPGRREVGEPGSRPGVEARKALVRRGAQQWLALQRDEFPRRTCLPGSFQGSRRTARERVRWRWWARGHSTAGKVSETVLTDP